MGRTTPSANPPRVVTIRMVTAVACLALAAVGTNVLLMPAAIVGLLAGGLGIRRLGDDLEAAGLRLGVAVLVSAIVAVFCLASGVLGMALLGILALVLFTTAWRACERLRRTRRLAWGTQQRQVLDRQAELHRRQAALRDRPVGRPDDGAPQA